MLYLNFPRSHLASLLLSRSLCRFFCCFLSAFSSFYFLLIIFNFFSVSILALLRVFSPIFSFFLVFFLDALFLALASRQAPAAAFCAPVPQLDVAGHSGVPQTGHGTACGTARRAPESPRLVVKLYLHLWRIDFLLLFFCFSFSLISAFAFVLSRCFLVAFRAGQRVFMSFVLFFAVLFLLFIFWPFFLRNLRCLRLVNFLARLQTWPAGARQVLGSSRQRGKAFEGQRVGVSLGKRVILSLFSNCFNCCGLIWTI